MARVKRGISTNRKHKKVLKQVKGYYGSKSKLFKTGKQALTKSLTYSFVGQT